MFDELWRVLRELFPVRRRLRGHPHVGRSARDPARLVPSVGLDARTGIGWGGGYVGDGVASSNLAGRTLADLVRGERTARTGCPGSTTLAAVGAGAAALARRRTSGCG